MSPVLCGCTPQVAILVRNRVNESLPDGNQAVSHAVIHILFRSIYSPIFPAYWFFFFTWCWSVSSSLKWKKDIAWLLLVRPVLFMMSELFPLLSNYIFSSLNTILVFCPTIDQFEIFLREAYIFPGIVAFSHIFLVSKGGKFKSPNLFVNIPNQYVRQYKASAHPMGYAICTIMLSWHYSVCWHCL